MTTKQTVSIMIALIAIISVGMPSMAFAADHDDVAAEKAKGDKAKGEHKAKVKQKLEEIKQKLKAKLDNASEDVKQKLREKLDSMKEKHESMKEKHDAKKKRYAEMTPEEKKAEIKQIREDRKAERETRQNMTPEEKQAHNDTLREQARESRANNVSINQQMALGAEITDIVCPDEKELVIKISTGLPKCLGSDAALMLIDRGIVSYPDGS